MGQEGIDIYNSFDDNEIEEQIDGKTKKIKGKERKVLFGLKINSRNILFQSVM